MQIKKSEAHWRFLQRQFEPNVKIMKETVRDARDIDHKNNGFGKVRAKAILIVLQGSLKNPNY